MKLSKETVEILKDFSNINMSILLPKGKKIKTINPVRTIVGEANVLEEFPQNFAIYDLKQFLSLVSMFEEPEFKFSGNEVQISNASGARVTYRGASESVIQKLPSQDVKPTNPEVKCSLESAVLQNALKAASVLGLPEVAFEGRNGKVYLCAVDTKNDSSHKWEFPVGTTENKYRAIFLLDNLKVMPRDYDVEISSMGIARFASKTGDVNYTIVVEKNSTFE